MAAKLLSGVMSFAFVLPAFAEDVARAPGWMGVKLGPVPESLAAHLRIEGQGLMVLNVAVGSPADVADLHRFDVIVSYDGQCVPTDVREFAEMVRNTGADRKAKLKLHREGKVRDLKLVLKQRPRERQKYKYEEEPEEIWRDHFDVMGKVLKRLPDGRWQLEDMWDLDCLPKGLDEFFRDRMWDFGDIERRTWPGGEHWKSRLREFASGGGIEIEKHEDGKITVRRVARDGDVEKVEKKTYANQEELKQNDQEAYDLYVEMKSGRRGRLRPWFPDHLKSMNRHKWMEELNEYLDSAMGGRLHVASQKSFTSFSVDENGKIDVVIRSRDGEVKESYKDEADLQMRNPELHKRLEAIQKPDDGRKKEALAERKD